MCRSAAARSYGARILDKDVVVPEGAHIGLEADLDNARYHVSEGGIVVLGKSQLALP